MRTALRTIILAIREWLPSELFRHSEVGVWYDPSDFSTLFQGSAGTTPVTAVEQPVGLILDKSKGLVLGAELVTVAADREFSSDTGFWTKNSGVSIGSGVCSFSAVSAETGIYKALLTVGTWYEVTYSVTSISAGNVRLWTSGVLRSTSGTFTEKYQATSINFGILSGTINATCTIDNISVRELPGQHSKQATAAARPVLKATPARIDYDAVDDTLVATFAANLGTDCTVCRAVPSVGASILTAQTIGTTYTDNTDHCGLIIVNRALTAGETSSVTAYLNAKAGV